jgi:hypothetical protein
MSYSFHRADRKTHVKVLLAAVLCSMVAVFCLSRGVDNEPRASSRQVVKARATVDVSTNNLNAVR